MYIYIHIYIYICIYVYSYLSLARSLSLCIYIYRRLCSAVIACHERQHTDTRTHTGKRRSRSVSGYGD